MLDFTQAQMSQITLHFVGNRLREEGCTFSSEDLDINDNVSDLLLRYFLSPFVSDELYRFHHDDDLALNEVFTYASEIFANPKNFARIGKKIANHLYNKSTHPKVKGGELYLAYFQECVLDDEVVECLGLFKSENKDSYLRVFPQNNSFRIDHEKGINIKKLDKGCLIFNSSSEEGYACSIIDNSGKGTHTRYWVEDFLAMVPLQNDAFQSNQIIQVVNGFIRENQREFSQDESVSIKAKSLEFFQENETFKESIFEKKVFADPEVAGSFRDFKAEFEVSKSLNKIDEFEISQATKKKTRRILKSVIKLDKNFHIYVHASPDKIEKGFDEEKGQNYYKLYFKEEQ